MEIFLKVLRNISRGGANRSQIRFQNNILFRPLLFYKEKNKEVDATDPERLGIKLDIEPGHLKVQG